MERKYLFEAGLGVYSSYKTLIPVEQLQLLEKYDKTKYHIYSILACPQVYFRKEKTVVTDKSIKICLFLVKNGEEIEYELPEYYLPFENIDYSKIKLKTTYPYISLTIEINDDNFLNLNPDVNKCTTINAHDIFLLFSENLVNRYEFEVLYIGQSYGKRGERTAITRLSSHSTLQKILADCQSKYSDKHIYLLLLQIDSQVNMCFDGHSDKFTKTMDESDAHMKDVISNLPEEQQVVNISEAALINYFKPEYNKTFVENFPDENHKGYKQYFDLDYNHFVFELGLDFDDCAQIQLYTSTNRIDSAFDFVEYNLYNDPNRLNMYDLFRENVQ